uniref:Adhesion G protein-coupled receptor F5 n=1 Tax=Anabas testudineus TaxID=64144 RepID=A0A3Q1JYL4_ANATE
QHQLPPPAVVYEYIISIELNVSDVAAINQLRNILSNISYPVIISNQIQIYDINITTVCSPSSGGYQCRCEDQYRWSCDQCLTLGFCDNITGDTCGCINTIPPDGQYSPAVVYEYIISIELNVSDVAAINQLRNILSNISYPVIISNQIQIYDINITTVCSPTSGGYQCRCEDQYRWSCDQCLTLGFCDNITGDTCGCINTIPPDGQYCQSVVQNTPAVVYEYIISIELNVSDVAAINQLRNILSNISYPVIISNQIQIYDINITTVCSPSSGGYQCRCEDQYRWSCDQCLTLGFCDNITGDTCGCINTIPPDGQYCQSVVQNSNLSCYNTSPTVVYEYIISIELNVSDVAVINQLRNILSNISYPVIISNQIQIYDINITTVCYPSETTYQCRCEQQFGWPCEMCSTFGKCNETFDNTCECINAIPPNGHTLQAVPCSIYTFMGNYTFSLFSSIGVTSQSTSGSSTMSSTSTIAPTTYLTTATSTMANTTIPTTTTPMANTTISNQSTTTANNTTHTTVTTPAILTTTLTTTTTTATTTIPITTTTTTTSSTASTTLSTTATTPQPGSVSLRIRVQCNTTDCQIKNKNNCEMSTVLIMYGNGSVITDFVVQATQVNGSEIAAVNQNLPVAMSSVAPVIGSVSAVYNSLTPISTSGLIYTGSSMVLTCEPPSGIINKGSTWTFNSLQIKSNSRITITDTGSLSTLTVNNVILDDIGTYGCTLMSSALDFVQSGVVTAAQIKQAPNLQLQSLVNVKCTVGQKQPLLCCVQQPYTVQWFQGTTSLNSVSTSSAQTYCITYNFQLQSCSGPQQSDFTCMVDNPQGYKMTTTVKFFTSGKNITCNNSQYGSGQTGDTSVIGCDPGQEGSRTAVCQSTGQWIPKNDTCIVTVIKQLLIASQTLTVQQVPTFVMQLKNAVLANETQTATSSATVSAIVDILNTIANVPTPVNETVMRNVLDTVNAIIGDDAKGSWEFLNSQELNNASSILLGSLETISDTLDGAFSIITPLIQFNRTMISNFFKAYLNSSVTIDIPNTNTSNAFITTILFSSLNNVLSTRNSTNTTSNGTVTDSVINADVVLVKINSTIQNVTLKYAKLNNSLTLNPRCVFWNFKAFKDLGAWDDEGCNLVSDINNTVTCNCNHLTSFSILMSTYIPPSLREALDIITYVGVGISLASLVICLIIEAYVWKAITRNSTAYMRHVSIVNTALSLLIGDICFIIGASIAKNPAENAGQDYNVPVGPCSTATFFMHFFYLALFFWMLVSGLLLFYRTVMVFSHMSKSTMLAIGFSLGYGCPLIIAVITVAVTAPGHGYIRRDYACWLNWTETMALLALVIPALSIVFINILIIIVVVFKMLRRGVGDTAQRDEKHTLVVVARCVIILTPLFGLTWSLGVGTMLESTNKGIHIAFAFFNSLQVRISIKMQTCVLLLSVVFICNEICFFVLF